MGNPIENISALLFWKHAIDRGWPTDKFKGFFVHDNYLENKTIIYWKVPF